jgi:hypothetical protein
MKRIIIIILLCVVLFAALSPVPSAVFADSRWVTCTPISVVAYKNRVHIRCQESYSGIIFFAASTTDQVFADRVLDFGTMAMTFDGKLDILYEPTNTSGASIGCQIDDCRLIDGIKLLGTSNTNTAINKKLEQLEQKTDRIVNRLYNAGYCGRFIASADALGAPPGYYVETFHRCNH